ncbi:MAG TPA: ABC transporter permease [Blastocatellia bacterium]|nr:ABC transporter permease [Blastocatellia bacterium]
MHTVWHDLRYGLRVLFKKPGFTVVAVVALALGIGANTAIFSVVNAVLLRPLPYPNPEQLAWVWVDNRREGIREDITSYPNFEDWRKQNQVFQGLAGVRTQRFNLTGNGDPEEVRGASVSANFFELMGVSQMTGHGFTTEDEQEGHDQVVVLGHGLWQRRFGGDPGVVGGTISLNGRSMTVVGIMPRGFQFPDKVELWRPLAPNNDLRQARGAFWLPVIGRLKPGVTRAQAQAEMGVIGDRLEQQYPGANQGYGINVVTMQEQMVGRIRLALLVLLGAVAFVLLIACANVANLLLVRAASRQREIAIRAALGASRWRVVRQLLTESVLLAVAGGVIGLVVARWGLDLLVTLGPRDLPRLESVGLDRTVLFFTLGLSLLTGIVFGLVPALQSSRLGLNEVLKEGGRSETGGAGGGRVRGLLVATEIALSLVLLIGAGLLLRSAWRLEQVNPGFSPDHLLKVRLSLPPSKYREGTNVAAFYQQLIERLGALPGVQAVGATSSVMMNRVHASATFSIEGRPLPPQGQRPELPLDSVSPGYFEALGIPIVKGRAFTEQDKRDGLQVVIVNETMARRFWPGEDPVGKRFTFGDPGPNAQWLTVVGVVRDTKRQGLDTEVRMESFLPHAQDPVRAMEVVVRTADNPLAMTRTVREAVWAMDRDLPLSEIQTVEQLFGERVAPRRFNLLLFGLFAGVALVLAVVGIYGVMSYAVAQRTHEIGIRMALGAQRGDVVKLVISQGMRMVVTGVVVGLAGAFALTRLMAGLLFGVSAADPLTFALIAVLLLLVALVACYLPARRATRVDPLVALRYE